MRALLPVTFVATSGCNGVLIVVGDATQSSLDAERVHGWVGGQPFVLDRAETAALLLGNDVTTLELYPAGVTGPPCGEAKYYAETTTVMVGRIDLASGEWTDPDIVSFNWLLDEGWYGTVAESATFRIDEVESNWNTGEPSMVRGWLSAWRDEETHVEGTFDAYICYTDDLWP